MDAFERLVADARDTLSVAEGAPVSWREICRRAGFGDNDFGRVSYHLLPRNRTRGHHVPAWLINALAPVLPVSRLELNRAAAEAAGYELTGVGDDDEDGDGKAAGLAPLVLRVLGDEHLTPDDRRRIGLDVIGVIMRAIDRPPS